MFTFGCNRNKLPSAECVTDFTVHSTFDSSFSSTENIDKATDVINKMYFKHGLKHASDIVSIFKRRAPQKHTQILR